MVMTMGMEHRTVAVSLTAAIVMLATLGVVPNAAALPANATAGPVPTSETPAPPAATRTLPPVITAPIGLARSYSYTFKLNSFRSTDTRSVHNDTDFVSIAVAVGSNAPVTLPAVSMGGLNNGTYPVNISIPNIEVAAGERVAFSYSIVNTGYDQNTVEHDLSSAVASAAADGRTSAWLARSDGAGRQP